MNKPFIIILCLLAFTHCKKKQTTAPPKESDSWKRINQLQPTAEINDMCLSNTSTMWAVGSKNYAVKSTDGGASWQNVIVDAALPAYAGWLSIFFRTPQLGYIAGGQFMYKTTDGGATWKSIIKPGHKIDGIVCIYFITDSIGFVGCGAGKLYRTTDGGATWQDQSTPTLYTFWSFTFFNEQYGWVGGGGTLLRTIDGGKNWITLHSSKDSAISPFFSQIDGRNIAATSTTDLFYATNTCLVSTDGGTIWKSTTTEMNGRWILMRNKNEGFCVITQDNQINGYSSMAHTLDGGTSWSKFNISTDTESFAKKIIRFKNMLYVYTSKNEIYQYSQAW